MSFTLEGRRALVTGASRGIGRAMALAFADAGADVALLARDEGLLAEVAAEVADRGRVAVVSAADVLDAESVRSAVEATAEALGLHQIQPSAADQQAHAEQQHHRRQATEPRQQLGDGARKAGKPPEQFGGERWLQNSSAPTAP